MDEIKYTSIPLKELYEMCGIQPAATYPSGAPNYGSRGTRCADWFEAQGVAVLRTSGNTGVRKCFLFDEKTKSLIDEYKKAVEEESANNDDDTEGFDQMAAIGVKLDRIITLLEQIVADSQKVKEWCSK